MRGATVQARSEEQGTVRETGTDGEGRYRLEALPPGTWTVYAYSRRAEKPASARVTVAAGAATEVTIPLAETRSGFPHRNKYGEAYRPGGRYE